MKSRRTFLSMTGASVAMAAIGVSGCSEAETGTEPTGATATSASDAPAAPADFRFSWWGNDVRADLTKQAVDLYQAEHPNVTVTLEPSDWGGYWDKLATTVAAGSAPDLMQQVDPYIIEYAERGVL
ncbi:MAG: extracellular solute-binding protein, partial [Propioniciclava sp.]